MNLPGISAPAIKVGNIDTSRLSVFGVPIFAIAISVIVSLFVVFPKFSQILSLRAANNELNTRALALENKAEILSSQNTDELKSQLGLAEQLLPSDKGTFAFVRQVEIAAASSGVFVDKIEVVPGSLSGQEVDNSQAPAGETVPAAAPNLQVKVSTTSNYQSLLNFMRVLFSVSRVVGVDELTISSEAETASVSALKSSFVISAFWKPLPSELGSVESPVAALSGSEIDVLEKAKSSEVGGAPSPVVPEVETGRSDLFTPF